MPNETAMMTPEQQQLLYQKTPSATDTDNVTCSSLAEAKALSARIKRMKHVKQSFD